MSKGKGKTKEISQLLQEAKLETLMTLEYLFLVISDPSCLPTLPIIDHSALLQNTQASADKFHPLPFP